MKEVPQKEASPNKSDGDLSSPSSEDAAEDFRKAPAAPKEAIQEAKPPVQAATNE